LDVNVALNRPTYQTNEYSDADGSYPAYYGNDGNYTTVMAEGCATVNVVAYPWWVVDLRAALHVLAVKFTNIGTNGTYRNYTVFQKSSTPN